MDYRLNGDGDRRSGTVAGRIADLVAEAVLATKAAIRGIDDVPSPGGYGGSVSWPARDGDTIGIEIAIEVAIVGRDIDGNRDVLLGAGLIVGGLGCVV